MSYAFPAGPTLGGFINFISLMLSPPSYFDATSSAQVGYSFTFAVQWVNPDLSSTPSLGTPWPLYDLAVYNLAADTLIAWQPDGATDPVYKDDLQYWAYLRKSYNVLAFIPGIVQSSSDEGTSVGYMLPKAYEGYTIANIQNTKTPYGRAYLGIAQSQGTLWGLT